MRFCTRMHPHCTCVLPSKIGRASARAFEAVLGGSGPAVWWPTLTPSPPFPLPSLSLPFPRLASFPSFPFPSPSRPPPLPQSQGVWGSAVSSHESKCIFSIFLGTETCLAVTILLLFVRIKCQLKLKNHIFN